MSNNVNPLNPGISIYIIKILSLCILVNIATKISLNVYSHPDKTVSDVYMQFPIITYPC